MLASKNRRAQCKETEQLFQNFKSGNATAEIEAFAQKYSKFAVKRLLLFHFEKSFKAPINTDILNGPETLADFLDESGLSAFVEEFAPEIPQMFIARVNWDVSRLIGVIRSGATVPSFPEAFNEVCKKATLAAFELHCTDLLQRQTLCWNDFYSQLRATNFASLLTTQELHQQAEEHFVSHYSKRIVSCPVEIVDELVQLMTRSHLERLHEGIVHSACKSLLNVGQDTEQIVQKLVQVISILQKLDSSGFLASQILTQVRQYLKHRKDMNRSLLRFLLQSKESFSFSNATVASPHALHFEELQSEENWQPEPTFVTESVSKVAKTAHPVVLILLSLSSMEALQDEFQNYLAEQLFQCPSDESVRELASTVSNLRKRCEFELSAAAEVMFRDVFENRAVSQDFSVTIISHRYWPERSNNSLPHPENIFEKLDSFANLFHSKHDSKCVKWRPHLDEVDLEISFTNRAVQFRAPPEAAILLSSFDFPADAQESFSFSMLAAVSGISDKKLLKSALLFWLKKRVIVPCPTEPFHFRFASTFDASAGDCVDAHLTLVEPNDEFADEEQDVDAEVLALQRFWPIIANMFKTFGQLSLERIHSTLSMFSKEYKGPVTLLSRFLQQKVKEGVLNVSVTFPETEPFKYGTFVSIHHQKHFEKMLEWLWSMMDWLRSLFFREEMEITLVGLQNSGKTTLVNVIATGQYQEDMIPTVGFNMRKITKGRVTMKIWDIGGQPRFRSMWERYCRGVNAIVFVVDAADMGKMDTARNELRNLLEKPQMAGIPVLVLGNKNDLPEALNAEQLIDRLGLASITTQEVSCYSISAKNQNNLDITLQWLIKHAAKRD